MKQEVVEHPAAGKEETHRYLVERLGAGWRALHADVARDFVSRLKSSFAADAEIKEVGDGFLHFVVDLSQIRVRGMDAVPSLLIGGSDPSLQDRVTDFYRKTGLGRIPFVIAASEFALEAARKVATKGRCLLVGPEVALELLQNPAPAEVVKAYLRRQVHRRDLIPFNVERPALGAMFCGRQRYLDRVRSDTASFAVAGPGRLGKTSLLMKLREDLVRSRDPRALSTFYISLYRVERSSKHVAQLLALSIDGTSRSSSIAPERLEQFFRFWSSHFGRPLDLLLDEIDEVLALDVFDTLEMIARQGYCRLVLAGKAKLLTTMLDQKRALAGRVSLMRLEPLTDTETETLFLGPLLDIGFQVAEAPAVLRCVCDLTGKMPHMVQYYGRAAANLLLDRGANVINPSVIADVRDQFETATYAVGALTSLPEGNTKRLALALLNYPRQQLTVQKVQSIARNAGLVLSADEIWKICNDLVMDTVLNWDRTHFELANGSLMFHAQASGLVTTTLPNVA
jgi:hypothetical protein